MLPDFDFHSLVLFVLFGEDSTLTLSVFADDDALASESVLSLFMIVTGAGSGNI